MEATTDTIWSRASSYGPHHTAFTSPFGCGDEARVFMSSSDLMERNLDWRVEAAFPIYDPDIKRQVLDMVGIQIEDNCKARILDKVQQNTYVRGRRGGRRAQYATYAYFRANQANRGQTTK